MNRLVVASRCSFSERGANGAVRRSSKAISVHYTRPNSGRRPGAEEFKDLPSLNKMLMLNLGRPERGAAGFSPPPGRFPSISLCLASEMRRRWTESEPAAAFRGFPSPAGAPRRRRFASEALTAGVSGRFDLPNANANYAPGPGKPAAGLAYPLLASVRTRGFGKVPAPPWMWRYRQLGRVGAVFIYVYVKNSGSFHAASCQDESVEG